MAAAVGLALACHHRLAEALLAFFTPNLRTEDQLAK